MRLFMDRSAGARAVYVPCYRCGGLLRMSDAQIDLDGPAYLGYYHRGCIPVGEELAPETRTFAHWRAAENRPEGDHAT